MIELDRVFTIESAAAMGYSRQKLATMAKSGEIKRIARGVYAKCDSVELSQPEMIALAMRKTECVVALESALRLHGFTTAMPHALWIAMRRGARKPSVDFPLEVVRIDEESFACGRESIVVDGIPICVFSAAKTVADLFKFRGRVGLSVAIEALKEGLGGRIFTVDELLECALADRVKKVIMPYVEGIVG